MFNICYPYFDTPTDAGGSSFTIDGIFESLSAGDKDEKVEDKKLDEKKDDKKEEDKDSIKLLEGDEDENEDDEELDEDDETEEDGPKEEEKELELDDEAEEDEIELARIPTRAQIKAKYPNIFKEFKALDHIFHREKAFAEVFPTVKDAKVARESIGEYNQIQSELLNGNIVGTLNRVKESNPKAYQKIASNIINSLIKVDPDSYKEPAVEVIKGTLFNLNNVAAAALKRDPENKRAQQIQIAVELVHEYLFQTDEVTPFKREEKEEKIDPETEKFNKEKAEFENGKFTSAHEKVSRRFDSVVTIAINKYVDPGSKLTDYIKNKVVADVKNELDRQLIDDKRFGGIVQKLYIRAKESNYSEESVNNIVTALKNKAGSILLPIIRAKRGEALKGSSSSSRNSSSRELSRERKGSDATTRSSAERKSGTRSENRDTDKGPKPGESAYEYLQRTLD